MNENDPYWLQLLQSILLFIICIASLLVIALIIINFF